jgi:hypothetical protein
MPTIRDALEESASDVQPFLGHIASYEREFKKWEGRAEKILKRYRDEMRDGRRGYTESRYNILWANVQTLKSATFARLPKPDVSRRFNDQDPVGRVAALLLERALDYEISHYNDYRDTLMSSLSDRFLGGRGTAWVRYEPKFTPIGNGEDYDGDQVTEDVHVEGAAEENGEMLDYECAPVDYVHWKDFGHSVARTWEEVTCVWRKVFMTRDSLVERFGEELGKTIPLDASPDDSQNKSRGQESEGLDKRALIFEIWDKETGKAYWLSKSLGKIIDEKDDPLGLEGFFPCPRPLYATMTNETLVPIPDFSLYQDQANELDILCDRIDGLIKALKVSGVYDASIKEISRLFTEADNNTLIPVTNWSAFSEKNGLKGALDLVDIQPIAQSLNYCYTAMQQVKQQIYDITGISDIVRGQSVASETATAQQIKGQYASLRLKAYQDEVVRFATHMIQLKAQIICKHFDPQTLLQISSADQLSDVDKQLIPQALQMLSNAPMRTFRIEISSDSMVMADESQEKQDRMEFLGAVSGFLQKSAQAAQASPELVPLMMEMLKFGVTGFKVGKGLEGQIDQATEQMKQMIAQKQQQPPQPTPEQMKAQQDQAAAQQKAQQDQQNFIADKAKFQADVASRQFEQKITQQKLELDNQRSIFEAQLAQDRLDFEKWKVQLENETRIIVAELSAKATMSKQQDDAADMAINDEIGES